MAILTVLARSLLPLRAGTLVAAQIVTRFPDSLDSLFGPDLYFGPDMLLHRFYSRLVSTRRRFTNICIRDFRGQRLQRRNNCRIGKERRVIDRSGAGPWNMDRYFDDWDSEAVLLTAKLKTNNRARRKEQYLRIQACTLARSHPEPDWKFSCRGLTSLKGSVNRMAMARLSQFLAIVLPFA